MGKAADEEPTRDELIVARDNLRRRVEILRSDSPYQGSNRHVQVDGLIAELQDELDELEGLIAEWKPD